MVDYRLGSGDYTGGFEGAGDSGYPGYSGYSDGVNPDGGYSGYSGSSDYSGYSGGGYPAPGADAAAGNADAVAGKEGEKIVLGEGALGLLGRVNMSPPQEYVERLLGGGCRDYQGVVKMFMQEQLFNKICPEWADTDTYPSVFADFITKDEWCDPWQSKIYDQHVNELEEIYKTRESAVSSSANAVMKALEITHSAFFNYSHNILWRL